ncbi:MAG TPA: hypothetical protein VK722_10305 [Candidatus Aquilonibacter sp.]|jgi:hypothetical protein|nr:hypothetical protein [Candidatus Aquilonibacter sp.]
MSDKITFLYYFLWITQPVLQSAIAISMLRSGRQRQFKYFFAYIVAEIIAFAVVFPTYRYNPAACLYLSWCSTAVSVALGFKVIHEAFLDAFRPFHTLRDLGTVLFKWAGLVMLLVAGVVSISTNSLDVAPWMQAILTAQRCVRIIQVGMVLFLLFFARYLGVSRRQYSFGVALGFGCFAIVELSLVASWVGDHLNNLSMNLVNMVAYNLTLIIWLGYTLAKSPARDASTSLLRPQRWEQSLTDIHHPVAGDSLIPMFEGMVDRALSRTQTAPPAPQPDGSAAKSASAHAAGSGGSSLGFSGITGNLGSRK